VRKLFGYKSAMGIVRCRPCVQKASANVQGLTEATEAENPRVRCDICGYDASYPLYRDYKLWELDGSNCILITGMKYEELRENATRFFGGTMAGNQNSPLWDTVLELDARTVWSWRRQTGLIEGWES
jgi:hypothetical protein